GGAQGEEEAHADRLAALLERLAGGVVDGRDVVGVEGMAQAERVGQPAQGQERRMPGAVGQERADTRHVNGRDGQTEATQAPTFGSIEDLFQTQHLRTRLRLSGAGAVASGANWAGCFQPPQTAGRMLTASLSRSRTGCSRSNSTSWSFRKSRTNSRSCPDRKSVVEGNRGDVGEGGRSEGKH